MNIRPTSGSTESSYGPAPLVQTDDDFKEMLQGLPLTRGPTHVI